MPNPIITHTDIAEFSESHVNLPSDLATLYREQVNRLRKRLEKHIAENPGFAVVKMLHAGSVAKGTALRSINDLDVAIYVSKEATPTREEDLVPWIGQRLREAYSKLSPDQIDDTQPHCVTIHFEKPDLDIDVVPVLYEGEANDIGYLVSRHTGERILTSIPLHLDFIRKRKGVCPVDYAQIVRLLKWWAVQQKELDPEFKCKSFLLELITAHLLDGGEELSDYPGALDHVFTYMVRSGLEERIAFTDYYPKSKLPGPTGNAIEIFDPVNPENNITDKYETEDRERLVFAAEKAADAISEARYSTTKSRAVERWQEVLGPSFRG